MSDCVFCKIRDKEIPSNLIYEDDIVMVILSIEPAAPGHMLVIPKNHFRDIFSTPCDILGHMNIVCKKMAVLLEEKLSAEGVNILNASGAPAQQSVFHIHYHVVPRYANDKLDLWFHGPLADSSNSSDSTNQVKHSKPTLEEIKNKLLS